MSELALEPVSIAGYYIDVYIDESHDLNADVVDVPVEEGSSITDHINIRPFELSLTCVVSDSPIGQMVDFRNNDNAFAGTTGSAAQKPSFQAYQFLKEKWTLREPVEVVTRLETYKSMAIQSISFPRTSSTGESLEFRIHLREVQIVSNNRTAVKVAIPRAKAKGKKGKKPSKDKPALPKVKTHSVIIEKHPRFNNNWSSELAGYQ